MCVCERGWVCVSVCVREGVCVCLFSQMNDTIFTDNRPYCEQPYIGFIRPKCHNSIRVFCNVKALGLCI